MMKMIPIARVGAPYRLKGELKLHLLSDSAEKALSYGKWYLKKPNMQHWEVLENESVSRLGDKILIQFEGIHTKEAAALLTHALIGVPRSALDALDQDEFYQVDLIGLEVKNPEGEGFGKVVSVLETGANEVLCCQDGKKETLIPFINQYVREVCLDRGYILVDWQSDYQ